MTDKALSNAAETFPALDAPTMTLSLELGGILASWQHADSRMLASAHLQPTDGTPMQPGMPIGGFKAVGPPEVEGSFGSSCAESTGDEVMWLCSFHIKVSCVDDFKRLMREECATVLAVEPGMLRYELMQSTDDPCIFLVVEIVADLSAIAVHEARRVDGTLRAAIKEMEAVDRHDSPMRGVRWSAAGGLRQLQWAAACRESAVLRMLCGDFLLAPPPNSVKPEGASPITLAAIGSTRQRRLLEWLTVVLAPQHQVASASFRTQQKMGGMSGEIRFLDVTMRTGETLPLVLKSATGSPLRKTMGNAREACFYNELAAHLSVANVPTCFWASSLETGEVVLLLEALENAVPAGTFFGAAQPNNWAVAPQLKALCAGNPGPEAIAADAFTLYARMHGTYWQDAELLSKPWLRGAAWHAGKGEAVWRAVSDLRGCCT
mmetsp:Transcript_31767/g.73969  ORF Transcript_31767/g.73969 Transcript_31767/m.73969 type:complete len:434 (-) Transcript_31767:6-1307(-)